VAQAAGGVRSGDVHYETVYDVLDDGYHVLGWEWCGTAIGGVILVLTVCMLHSHKWRLTGYPPRSNPWGVLLVAGIIEIGFVSITLSKTVEQYRCKCWAATGDYQTVEGGITGWSVGHSGYTAIYVANVRLIFRDLSGGFRGEFTKPGVDPGLLRKGQPVRIAFHEGEEGRILRIEVPSP
jgi:hypothetical protein